MIRSNSLVLSPGFARPFARSLTPSGMGGGGVSIVNNGGPVYGFTKSATAAAVHLQGHPNRL